MFAARAPSAWLVAMVMLLAAGASALFGLLVSVQALLPLAALAGLLLATAVLGLKKELLIWLVFGSAFIAAGVMSYFLGIGQAQWIPIGLGAAMYGTVLFHFLGSRSPNARSIPPMLAWGAAFCVVAVVSTAWEGLSFGHWLYGGRYFFAMAPILLALAYLPWHEDMLRRLWIFLVVVALIQFPFALYQYVAVGGQRLAAGADGVAWDAVVGTLGGKQEGGGHSAAMGFFVVSVFLFVFALWKRGQINAVRAGAFTAVVLGVIFLAEVKAMVLIMPLGVAFVLRSQVIRHLRQVILGLLLVALLAVAMPVLYSKLHYERAGLPPVSTAEFYQRMIDNSDTEHLNKGTQQLGRVAQLVFWWRQHDLVRDPKAFLIGHGIGTTNAARIYVGHIVRAYAPLSVTNTSGGILLWETGLVGFMLALSGILWGAVTGLRLSRHPGIPGFHQAALEAGAAILLILIPALFYKHFALKSPAVQVLVFLAAGQALYWRTRLAQTVRRPTVSPAASAAGLFRRAMRG